MKLFIIYVWFYLGACFLVTAHESETYKNTFREGRDEGWFLKKLSQGHGPLSKEEQGFYIHLAEDNYPVLLRIQKEAQTDNELARLTWLVHLTKLDETRKNQFFRASASRVFAELEDRNTWFCTLSNLKDIGALTDEELKRVNFSGFGEFKEVPNSEIEVEVKKESSLIDSSRSKGDDEVAGKAEKSEVYVPAREERTGVLFVWFGVLVLLFGGILFCIKKFRMR
ncbi:hypothetical protein [Persicirhabdus sediminis]|uniref:Uncharacterized protein n=1 Tax=Persicirhabdus sediminis TaxID=454144 RepID=A0A8J7MD20_9BACT|nr:hypothetical protein [Persicirhabdus sediminis]MBK1791514.1 hypothetical protein [Persicirhabdus sediminis]